MFSPAAYSLLREFSEFWRSLKEGVGRWRKHGFSSAAYSLLREFSEFWRSLKEARSAGLIHEWIVHRVREEWVPWWLSLPMDRRIRIANDLASLDEEERKWFLHLLRNTIEADREQEGSPSNGPGAGNWVFMQLAHIEPFERSQVFAAWRLDQVEGFRALCLHPHRSLPILCTLLRRGDEAPHYEYNVRLTDAVGVLSALSAVDHLLKHWNPLFFNGRPRGCSHHPLALRLPLTASLILGPLCIAILYVASSIGRLSEALLFRLQYGAFLCSLLFLIFWLIGILSDWRAERRLAAALEGSQVAWALGQGLPSPTSRNSLVIQGESYSAALALNLLHSLAAREDGNCWISWHLHRAARNMETLGITGDLSPTGKTLRVNGFDDKKPICIREGLALLSPDQARATATAAEIGQGLKVTKCTSLEGMIWAASHASGVALWLGAAAAVLMILFSLFARGQMRLPPAPDLDVSEPPIIEDRGRHIQHLILHFRTTCAECFIVRIHSTFWKTPGEQYLAQVKDSEIGRAEEHTSELQSLRHLVCR